MATEHVLVPRQKYEQLTASANSYNDGGNNIINNNNKDSDIESTERKDNVNRPVKYEQHDGDYLTDTDVDDGYNDSYNSDINSDAELGYLGNTQQDGDNSKKQENTKKKKKTKKNPDSYNKRTREDIVPRPPGILKKDVDIVLAKRRRHNVNNSKQKKINIKKWIKW